MAKKNIFVGMLVGLVANGLGLFLAACILGQSLDIVALIETAYREGLLGKLISLGALLNLFAFFKFMRNRQDYRARGVLLITMIIAIVTLVFKFL